MTQQGYPTDSKSYPDMESSEGASMETSFWPTWKGEAMPIYVNAMGIQETKDGQYLLEFAYLPAGHEYEATDSPIKIVIGKELFDAVSSFGGEGVKGATAGQSASEA